MTMMLKLHSRPEMLHLYGVFQATGYALSDAEQAALTPEPT